MILHEPHRCRFFTVLAICISMFLGAISSSVSRGSEPKVARKPNIVFILTDDQRFDALGCAGNPVVKTPNLDGLAARGVRFTNMFCTTSICAISRATFMTGQWERRHGIKGFRKPLSETQFANSFPALLRKNGYRAAFIGKWGLGGKLPKEKYDDFRGFRGQGRYYPKGKSAQPGEHLTHKLGDQAVEFLDGCSKDEPFVLQYYTKAAHCQDGNTWPFQADVRYKDLYADEIIPVPSTATEKYYRRLPVFLQNSEARKRWKIRFSNPQLYQKSVKDYYRLVTGIDDVVGRMVKKLKEKHLFENTVIIFTSDNGFYLGEHGLAGKWFMHEESIRLPLIVFDPRLPVSRQGKTNDELVLNADIAPTIVSLAGVAIPKIMQGKDLSPLFQGKSTDWRDDFLYEHRFKHPTIPMNEGVRGKRWKYVRYTSVDPVYEELFDLKNDPHETENLAKKPEYRNKLTQMRKRWRTLSKSLE